MRLRLVPTHCDSCSRSSLTQSNLLVAGVMTCPACGATARSVPGSSYSAEDLPVFDEVLLALGQAEVEPTQAAKWLVELNDGTGSAPGSGLRRLAGALPSLAAVANGFGGQAKALRKADGLLLFLLEAVVRSGRQGGVKYSRRAAPVHGELVRRPKSNNRLEVANGTQREPLVALAIREADEGEKRAQPVSGGGTPPRKC